MKEPLFLSVSDVEKLHAMALERFGGSEGLRDRNAFESAVNQPKNIFYYDQGDIHDIAAAYCFHIAQAQAFLDGNKRTGAAAAIVFLEANGFSIKGDSLRIHGALIAIAINEMDRSGLAALLRELTA
ncbi:MAG: death-on-curing protein [Lentimonas sp.]|jgi:death-on-curing protein